MNFFYKVLPFAVMISSECLDVGLTTLSKAAFSSGINHFVFVVYSNGLAAILLCPLAFFIDRGKRRPLTWSMLGRFFLFALCGITVMQNCVFTGVNYTSPTLATAMGNLIPAFTFILSVICRLEKVDIRSSASQAKVLGTLISVGGAMIVALYKGQIIRFFLYLNHDSEESHYIALKTSSVKDWIVATLQRYPAELSIVAFMTTLATMQSAILTSLVEHNLAVWSLKWDIDVISISYSAIIGTGLTYTLQTWCNRKKGPLFVAMFKPIGIVIAAIASAVFLGDKLHIGSVVGAFFIVLGFYAVMWAKSKDIDSDSTDKLPSIDPVTCQSDSINGDPSETRQLLLGHRDT